MLSGEIRDVGAQAPGAVFDAQAFLRALAPESVRQADQAAADARRLHAQGRIKALQALDADRAAAAVDQALAAQTSQVSLDQLGVFLALGGGVAVIEDQVAAKRRFSCISGFHQQARPRLRLPPRRPQPKPPAFRRGCERRPTFRLPQS